MKELARYLEDRKALVEAWLARSLVDDAIPVTLGQAMTYSLTAGGKRIRSILTLAGAEAVGGRVEAVMPLAVAIEMIHTFSLIHDDLPAMDNDDLRRGRPTNHKVYGEAMAILAGDGLVFESFSVLASLGNGIPPQLLVEVIRELAAAGGARGMTGGQVIDIEATGKSISERELERVHRHKTGKLLAFPAWAGAKLSGASIPQLAALKRYGEAVGLAFQIADDILDVEGTESEIGKDLHSDEAKHKATYPAIVGMVAAKRKAAAQVDEAMTALVDFDDRAEPLRAIARYIVERRM